MRLLFLGSGLCLLLNSCQTLLTSERVEARSALRDSIVFCALPLSPNQGDSVTVEIRFPESKSDTASISLKTPDQASVTLHVQRVPADGLIILPISDKEELAISVIGKPVIAKINPDKDLSSPSSCTQLLTSNGQRPPSCQAVGTPAEGWYQSGRIIQHTNNCYSEILTCGSLPTSGWYSQKKLNSTKISSGHCANQSDSPKCHTIGSMTGWFLNDHLVAEDARCGMKDIECGNAGSPNEGWVTFERSAPKLVAAETCQSNRNISYLSR